jgi:hypothetical protein
MSGEEGREALISKDVSAKGSCAECQDRVLQLSIKLILYNNVFYIQKVT